MTLDRLPCYRGPLDGEERELPSDHTQLRARVLVYDAEGHVTPAETYYAIYQRRMHNGKEWLVYQEEQLEWIECVGGSKHGRSIRVSPNDIWVRVLVPDLTLAVDVYERVQQASGLCMLIWRRTEPHA